MPQPIDLPAEYDPHGAGQANLRYRYKKGDRSPEAIRARSLYMAYRARHGIEERPAPAPAETPRTAPAERPTAPPAETRPAVPGPPPARAQHVLALPASRRLQGLAWMGWDPESIREQIGLETPITTRLLFTPPALIPEKLDQEIRAGFRRLIVRPRDRDQPRAAMWRDIARVSSWASPYQWNDIDHDDAPTYKGTTTEHPETEDEGVPLAVDTDAVRDLEEQLATTKAEALRVAAEQSNAITMAEQERDAAERQVTDTTAALAEAEARVAQVEDRNARQAEMIEFSRGRIGELEAELIQTSSALATEQEKHAQTRSAHMQLTHSFGELERLTANHRARKEPTGRVIVDQLPDGGSRITFESSRPAQVRFAGLEVSVADIAAGA